MIRPWLAGLTVLTIVNLFALYANYVSLANLQQSTYITEGNVGKIVGILHWEMEQIQAFHH